MKKNYVSPSLAIENVEFEDIMATSAELQSIFKRQKVTYGGSEVTMSLGDNQLQSVSYEDFLK